MRSFFRQSGFILFISLTTNLTMGETLAGGEKPSSPGEGKVFKIGYLQNDPDQKFGFEWVAFYQNAIRESRKLKPEIPQYGNDGIPIKHEIEFEYILKDRS